MNYEAIRADEFVARFKSLRSEQTRFKLRKLIINLRLARIYTLLFFIRLIRNSAQVSFDVFDHIKKFVGHDGSPARRIRTTDLRRVK